MRELVVTGITFPSDKGHEAQPRSLLEFLGHYQESTN